MQKKIAKNMYSIYLTPRQHLSKKRKLSNQYYRNEYEVVSDMINGNGDIKLDSAAIKATFSCEMPTAEIIEKSDGLKDSNQFKLLVGIIINDEFKPNEIQILNDIWIIFDEDGENISIMFIIEEYITFILQVTVSLIDLEGELRFPQSFVYEYTDTYPYDDCGEPFGFPNFLKRTTLMSSDFLPSDTFNFHFEIMFASNRFLNNYIKHEKLDKDFDIWKTMCANYPYARLLRDDPAKREEFTSYARGRMIDVFIDFIVVDKCLDKKHIDDCLDMYVYADEYGMLDIMTECRNNMKKRMNNEYAVDILVLSDMHSDAELKEYATQYIITNWNEITKLDQWNEFKELRFKLYPVIETRKNSDEAPEQVGRISETNYNTDRPVLHEFYQ